LDRAGPLGFPLPVAEIKLGLHGPMISPPVLSAIQAKTIGPNAGGEEKWVAQSEVGEGLRSIAIFGWVCYDRTGKKKVGKRIASLAKRGDINL